MKRIVFDCDRCGKKDIGEPVTIFHTDGADEGQKMTADEFGAIMERTGKLPCTKDLLGDVLEMLHRHEGWEHYCSSCFRKVVASCIGMLGPTAKSRKKASAESGMSTAGRAIAAKNQPKTLTLEPESHEPANPGRGRKKSAD